MTAADTSSAAAGTNATVGGAAAICASLSSEPIPARSVAAAVIISGAAITYDMSVRLLGRPRPSMCIPLRSVCSSGLLHCFSLRRPESPRQACHRNHNRADSAEQRSFVIKISNECRLGGDQFENIKRLHQQVPPPDPAQATAAVIEDGAMK